MTTVDTAEIAANARHEIATMVDRQAATAVFTARELGIRRWMLDAATVTHTDRTITVHFPRGKATTAYILAGSILDRASEHLPLESGGVIVEDNERTFTLKF